jgi:hypothetical protein
MWTQPVCGVAEAKRSGQDVLQPRPGRRGKSMQKIVLARALACAPTRWLAILAIMLGGAAAPAGQAHAATWKETQKGGWERTCHDGDGTACTVWENHTQDVICHDCAETPYKVQPPLPDEPVVKVQQQQRQQSQQQRHITADELITHQISVLTQKDLEAFAAHFKQFTGVDFTDKVLLKLQIWGEAAAVDVSMAESNNVVPSSHDTRHCRTTSEGDATCFEQWLYTNLEAELPSVVSEKGSQRTKMVTTDKAGRVEAVQFCQGVGGVIACVIDIEGKTKAYWFGLKHDQKGLVAQIYWPKPSKTTQ